MSELVNYFNQFYQIVFKDLINDPVVHSEWVYFISMLSHGTVDVERIRLYLGILSNEHKKKQEVKSNDTKTNSVCST
jgi:hypothetical protein